MAWYNDDFFVYKQALAQMERRNRRIIRELHLKHYEQALLEATTPAEIFFTDYDEKGMQTPNTSKLHKKIQLELNL